MFTSKHRGGGIVRPIVRERKSMVFSPSRRASVVTPKQIVRERERGRERMCVHISVYVLRKLTSNFANLKGGELRRREGWLVKEGGIFRSWKRRFYLTLSLSLIHTLHIFFILSHSLLPSGTSSCLPRAFFISRI